MLKIFFGIIIFYFSLYNSTIDNIAPSQDVFQTKTIILPLIPATPIKNENWNQYIVLSGNNFLNNYYIKPLRIKKKN
jgi:hypothetical protein